MAEQVVVSNVTGHRYVKPDLPIRQDILEALARLANEQDVAVSRVLEEALIEWLGPAALEAAQ